MSAQGKRDASVVITLPGACRRPKTVQWARSAVNQEDTCGAKKAGRDCGLEKCRCEPLLGRVLRYCTQTHSICSGAADLRLRSISLAITCSVVDRGSSMRAIKTTLAECRPQICAGAFAHACGGRGNSPEIGVIPSRDAVEPALAVEGGSGGGESWAKPSAVLCDTLKCVDDASSPHPQCAFKTLSRQNGLNNRTLMTRN